MSHALTTRGRYVPWLFVAGFAVVIAVNATMICFAVGSFSGLYTPKPRDRGVHYNQIVTQQKARDALGWRIGTAWRAESGRLEVSVVDAVGQPLAGARITAELIRPVEKRPPLPVMLSEIQSGRFAGSIELPARGNWDLDILVEHGGDRYALTRRMFMQ